jgi:hypothetical protein
VPIGSFADSGKIEDEVIVLSRALLEIEEITLNYGPDEDSPHPYTVSNKDGDFLFESDPNINATVKIVDDYADGENDDKKFFDKYYLKLNKKTGVWEAGENSKLGMLLKAHKKYGPKHFENPKPFVESDLVGMRFEAATEQKEDRSGKKLDGTRVAWLSIGAVPNRSKKKAQEKVDAEVEKDLTEEEIAETDEALSTAGATADA